MASNRKLAKTLQSHNVLVIIKLVMYTLCSISRANFDCYILNIIVVNCFIVMCGITVYNTIFFYPYTSPYLWRKWLQDERLKRRHKKRYRNNTGSTQRIVWGSCGPTLPDYFVRVLFSVLCVFSSTFLKLIIYWYCFITANIFN